MYNSFFQDHFRVESCCGPFLIRLQKVDVGEYLFLEHWCMIGTLFKEVRDRQPPLVVVMRSRPRVET